MSESQIVNQAFELLARASSTSEVLTLNLTNLLILLVLKAAIFGFGLFSSAGTVGRSSDAAAPAVKSSDLTGGMCFIMFTSGAEEKLSCIQRTACEDPQTAKDYLTAAKMIHNMGKYIDMDMSQTYVDVYNGVQEAAEHAVNGGDCARYNW